MKTLVLFAHPSPGHSWANRHMADAARTIPGITFVDLYALYPRFDIDVEAEQRRLIAHDAIVLQFPLMWYSTPPLLKLWQDLVLEHGFAYGTGGTALAGKSMLCAVTAGADQGAYSPEGLNRIPLRTLLTPLEATANLCRMSYLSPFVLFGAIKTDTERRDAHVESYRTLLEAMRDDRLDLAAVARSEHLLTGSVRDLLEGAAT